MGRPRKEQSEILVEVPCKVTPEMAAQIDAISARTDRSRSQIARKLISRGLSAFLRDGQLDELDGEEVFKIADIGLDIKQEAPLKPTQARRKK